MSIGLYVKFHNLKALDGDDPRPLYVQIADNILAFITDNRLVPGEQLPSQNVLMNYYGVSQITVRQAIQKLVNEGLLIGKQGKGVFVAEPMVRANIDQIDLIDRFSGGISKPAYELIETTLLYPQKRILKQLHLPEGAQVMRVRRKILKDGELLGMETNNFPLPVIQLFPESALHHADYLEFLNKESQIDLSRISFSTRGSLISDFDAEIMGVAENTFVLMQFGIFYNRSGIPIMTGRSTYLAEKMELHYEVNLMKVMPGAS
jgi:GntR family transcriptional regulator